MKVMPFSSIGQDHDLARVLDLAGAQLAHDLGSLPVPSAHEQVSGSLVRAHPCSLLDDRGDEARRDGCGGEGDEAHAGDADQPVREEPELAAQLVRRTVLEQRAEQPTVGVADGVDVVAARVLDRPEEDRCEEEHQEDEHRRQQEAPVHAVQGLGSCASPCHARSRAQR
jgi:hypothetical protein